MEYGQEGPPLRTAQVPHNEHCDPGGGYQHAPACWIEAVFDTGDGYRDDHGGVGTLQQRLVTGRAGVVTLNPGVEPAAADLLRG